MSSELDIPDDDFDSLGLHGTAKLVATLLEDVARNLKRAARAVVWLREQGCDVSAFEDRLPRGELRAIADGLILPEVWLKVGNQKTVMRAVSALPRDIQLKLVDKENPMSLEVVERGADGRPDVRKVRVENITKEMVPQVFKGSRIATVEEQMAATMRPVSAPVIDQPDREAWLAELKQLPDVYKTGTKREQRRAADRARELWTKLGLMVVQ